MKEIEDYPRRTDEESAKRIMVVEPGGLTDADKEKLEAAGIIVIETDSELKLLSADPLLPPDVALQCALKAMVSSTHQSTTESNHARFGKAVAQYLSGE